MVLTYTVIRTDTYALEGVALSNWANELVFILHSCGGYYRME